MERISCSKILQKLKTFEDRQNFVRELGNILYIIYRVYSAKRKGFRCQVFFRIFARK